MKAVKRVSVSNTAQSSCFYVDAPGKNVRFQFPLRLYKSNAFGWAGGVMVFTAEHRSAEPSSISDRICCVHFCTNAFTKSKRQLRIRDVKIKHGNLTILYI